MADAVVPSAGVVRAHVTLSNVGPRPALETVQAYVSDLVTSVTWAEKELKAWQQVQVPPGESVRIALEVPARACSLVTADGRRVVEAGEFELLVGAAANPGLLRAGFRIGG